MSAEENRRLLAFAQGYGGQAVDVTNKKTGAKSNAAAFAAANACWLGIRHFCETPPSGVRLIQTPYNVY